MSGEDPQLGGNGSRGCQRLALDVIIGAAEIAIVWIAVTNAVIALPPAGAPLGRYQHVVSLYTVTVMTAVLVALGLFAIRRRWIAAAIQMLVVLAALASVIFLHHHRISGGLTGY